MGKKKGKKSDKTLSQSEEASASPDTSSFPPRQQGPTPIDPSETQGATAAGGVWGRGRGKVGGQPQRPGEEPQVAGPVKVQPEGRGQGDFEGTPPGAPTKGRGKGKKGAKQGGGGGDAETSGLPPPQQPAQHGPPGFQPQQGLPPQGPPGIAQPRMSGPPSQQGPPPGMQRPRMPGPPSQQGPPPGMPQQRMPGPPSQQGPPPGMPQQRMPGPPPKQGPPPGMPQQRMPGPPPQQGPPPGMTQPRMPGPPSQQGPPPAKPQPRTVSPLDEASQAGKPTPSDTIEPEWSAMEMEDAVDVAKVTGAMAQTRISPPSGASGTSNVSLLQIPHRKRIGPIVGTKGRKILIEVNHLQLTLKKTNAIAIHYDVAFNPDLPKKLLRPAMEQFRRRHFPNNFPAFDGRKNLYSCGKLPIRGDEIRDTVLVNDEERQRDKEFDITVKFASQVDMSQLSTYAQNGRSNPQEAIQALDIVLRNPAAMNFTPVGRSFFTAPTGQVVDLGDGMELWLGFYQSAILGWKPYLNIDVAHKGFPSPQHLCEVVMKLRQSNSPAEGLKNPLESWERQNVEKLIKGLKVEYQIANQPNTRRTYKVNCLKGPCNKERFKMENGSEMTVAEYFIKEKRTPLRFPSMPCIHVGNEQKTIYLPLEFCKIVAGQVVNTKLNETQTANMVRAAAKPADERKRRILDAMRKANFNTDRCIQEFGVTVSQEFTKIDARILDPPKLEYFNNESVLPIKGVWRPSRFFKSNSLNDWRILNLDQRTRDDSLWNFASMMQKMGSRLGISIAKVTDVKTVTLGRQGNSMKQPIIEYFQAAKSAQLIVVIINDREPGIYSRVKQAAELNVGVLTQCIKSKTMFKMNDATCSNILLKVNSKLNGVNHQIDKSCRPKVFLRPIMVVGADVTHPSPDQKSIPSVAAVAASHDPTAFQYNMLWRLQPPRQEMIEDLEEMMKLQLKYFYKKTNFKPEKIIFYRDGVSEGQFGQVLDVELKAIRRACTSLDSSYNPPITFLVVQKRHHTRFFPTNPRDEDGRNKNVPAGTIVDTEITHPREMDFYLVSHASLQGTSRPTKYHKLWDDNDIDENDLEELTYYLCHLFSRCTRSVSYPAPTYYAHLAAFRARSYIEGSQISMTNLPNEQRQRTIQSFIVDKCPMFFV